MNKVLVLGGTGMLGAMVVDWLDRDGAIQVVATARSNDLANGGAAVASGVDWQEFEVLTGPEGRLRELVAGSDWVINAIGITKPYVKDDNGPQVERAILINSLFPYTLARVASEEGARVIQVATDCVFSGQTGGSSETTPHDPEDVYGKSKSLGEAYSEAIFHLRCSIIGPEPGRSTYLLEWFLGQPEKGTVNGFTNHHWNGVSTLHFARVCQGLIKGEMRLPHVQHLIPGDKLSKGDLLVLLGHAFGRTDIDVVPVPAIFAIDRTLSTERGELNRELWQTAGYDTPPSLARMMTELADFEFRFADLR